MTSAGGDHGDYLASQLDSEYGRHDPCACIDALGKVGSDAPEVMAILEEYRQKEPCGRRGEKAIDAIIDRSGDARQETDIPVEF